MSVSASSRPYSNTWDPSAPCPNSSKQASRTRWAFPQAHSPRAGLCHWCARWDFMVTEALLCAEREDGHSANVWAGVCILMAARFLVEWKICCRWGLWPGSSILPLLLIWHMLGTQANISLWGLNEMFVKPLENASYTVKCSVNIGCYYISVGLAQCLVYSRYLISYFLNECIDEWLIEQLVNWDTLLVLLLGKITCVFIYCSHDYLTVRNPGLAFIVKHQLQTSYQEKGLSC